jgi:hypothetical protein
MACGKLGLASPAPARAGADVEPAVIIAHTTILQ